MPASRQASHGRPGAAQLSERQRTSLIKMLQEGYSVNTVTQRFGLTDTAVRNFAKLNNIELSVKTRVNRTWT